MNYGSDITTVALRTYVAKSSRTPGYQTVTSSIGSINSHGSSIGFFYRNPAGVWHLLKTTQQPLLCSDFEGIEVRKAFLGEECEYPLGDNKWETREVTT